MLTIELKKKRAFRKFSYRGIDLDQYVASTLERKSGNRRVTDGFRTDSLTYPPNNSVMSSTPAHAVGSTAVSSASLWD